MALQKNIELESGIECSYINVHFINIKKDTIIAELAFYVSQQARIDGKEPVKFQMVEVALQDLPSDNPLNYLYKILKTSPVFEGAQDV
jgi:archaellin